MKPLLFILTLLVPALAFPQYLVIDPAGQVRTTKNIAAASSVTDLVIQVSDIDSVVAVLNRYKDLIRQNARPPFEENEHQAGATLIRVGTKKVGAVYRYLITIETSINGTSYRRKLTDAAQPNPWNARQLSTFIERILNGRQW